MLWKNEKRQTQDSFLHWVESLKMGNVSLKVREKSLNFLFKKGYAAWPSSICDNRAKFMQHYRGFTIKL